MRGKWSAKAFFSVLFCLQCWDSKAWASPRGCHEQSFVLGGMPSEGKSCKSRMITSEIHFSDKCLFKMTDYFYRTLTERRERVEATWLSGQENGSLSWAKQICPNSCWLLITFIQSYTGAFWILMGCLLAVCHANVVCTGPAEYTSREPVFDVSL